MQLELPLQQVPAIPEDVADAPRDLAPKQVRRYIVEATAASARSAETIASKMHGADAGQGPRRLVVDVEDDELIELEYEEIDVSGQRREARVLTLPDHLRAPASTTRDASPRAALGDFLLRPDAPNDRGVVTVLRSLNVFKFAPRAQDVVGLLASNFEDHVLGGDSALRHCQTPIELGPAVGAGSLDRSRPILLLLHGTASSTQNAFGQLAGSAEWQELARTYDRNLVAFDHRSLTQSPVQNAIEVLSALPEGARMHVLSHSRGGLVGELLCLARPDSASLASSAETRDKTLSAELEELRAVALEKRISVERFLRCACPARGTTLMTRRLDAWASLFLTGLGLVFKGNPVFQVARKLLLRLVAMRTDPKALPGLACMAPDSPLIHYLNTQRIANGELAILAGDARRPGLLGRLRALLTDVFFRQQNDLIVDTDSMYGGATRPNTFDALFQDTAATRVNHFVYFQIRDVRTRVLEYLGRGETKAFDRLPTDEPAESRDRLTMVLESTGLGGALSPPKRRPKAPIVVVLPGIMGSHLRVDNRRLWLNFWALVGGGLGELGRDVKAVPDGLVAGAYGRLVKFLVDRGLDVVLFPTDWRASLETEAARLADLLNTLRAAPARPIRFMAHSMGGLVARTLMVKEPKLWRTLVQEHDARLVMLGTPNDGSHAITQLFSGQHSLLKAIELIDSKHDLVKLTGIVRKFPGAMQMLPHVAELFGADFWNEIRIDSASLEAVPAQDLATAKQLRDELRTLGVDPQRMVYVAGMADYTASQAKLIGSHLEFTGTRAGDGTVTWESGKLPNVKTYYAQAEHGDLADLPSAFDAYLELLESGATLRLPTTPPSREQRAGAALVDDDVVAKPPEVMALFPGRADLEDLAIGRTPRSRFVPPESAVRVAVAHADARAIWEFRNEDIDEFGEPRRKPNSALIVIGVGHGEGLPYPEAALDELVMHGIGDRLAIGSLTGRLGSRSVAQSAPGEGPNVLVLGLGELRDVSTDALTEALTSALLDACLDPGLCEPDAATSVRRLRPILAFSRIRRAGFSETDVLTVGLQGVVLANRRLRAQGLWDVVRIDRVLFTETFEEDAIALLRIAREAESSPPFALEPGESLIGPRLLVAPTKLEMELPRRPVSDGQEQPWDRWSITNPRAGLLRLSASIRRARTEAESHTFNPAVVDRFVSQLTTTSAPDDDAVSYLRGHLLPDSFRIAFEQSRNILLNLDRATAPIPWEMFLIDISAESSAPSARLSMVRQLEEVKASNLPDVTAQNRALVIGPPDLSNTPGFCALPRAEAEALRIQELLRTAGYEVFPEAVNGQSGDAIRRAHARIPRTSRSGAPPEKQSSRAGGYSIVHLCGHGQINDDEARTGLVLAGGDTFSTLDLRTWPAIPAVVFFNCCHLGRLEDTLRQSHPGRLAASLAQACIQSGVRVVVAAGWAVNDAAAEAFARTFYERMLNGDTFGVAVASARMAAWRAAPRSLTWAAYQCYGDPHFVLPRIPSERSAVTRSDGAPLSSRRELEDFIREMTLRAYRHRRDERANAAARADLVEATERAIRTVPDQLWNGRLLNKMAMLWQQLGREELEMRAFSLASTYRDAPVAVQREQGLVTRSRSRPRSRNTSENTALDVDSVQTIVEPQILAPSELVRRALAACREGKWETARAILPVLDVALESRSVGGIEALARPELALLHALWPELDSTRPPLTLDDVANQYGELLETAAPTISLAASQRLKEIREQLSNDAQQKVDFVTERIAGIADQDDPNKDRFGGESTRDGLRLSAVFPANQQDQRWVKVRLIVEPTNPARSFEGEVTFHLHPTYNQPKAIVPVRDRRAELELLAWGAFTAGAEAGTTRLELDLAEQPDAPSPFKDR
jgi:pimeloyl-ACP methyl ester carboxylesterase